VPDAAHLIKGEKRLVIPADIDNSFRVAPSPIHGRGLFSVRARRPGEALYVVRGEIVNLSFDEDYGHGANWIGTGWETWLVPERRNPMTFTNHCCEPNVIVSNGFAVVAIEAIPASSEVLLDYATTEIDPLWRMRCRCDRPHCRKQVRSYPFISEALRARYAPYLPLAFLDAAKIVMASSGFQGQRSR